MGQSLDTCSLVCAPVKDRMCTVSVCAPTLVEPARPPRPDFSISAPVTIIAIESASGGGTASAPADCASRFCVLQSHRIERPDCTVSTPPVCEDSARAAVVDASSAKLRLPMLEAGEDPRPAAGFHAAGAASAPLDVMIDIPRGSSSHRAARRHGGAESVPVSGVALPPRCRGGTDGTDSMPPLLKSTKSPPGSDRRCCSKESAGKGTSSVPPLDLGKTVSDGVPRRVLSPAGSDRRAGSGRRPFSPGGRGRGAVSPGASSGGSRRGSKEAAGKGTSSVPPLDLGKTVSDGVPRRVLSPAGSDRRTGSGRRPLSPGGRGRGAVSPGTSSGGSRRAGSDRRASSPGGSGRCAASPGASACRPTSPGHSGRRTSSPTESRGRAASSGCPSPRQSGRHSSSAAAPPKIASAALPPPKVPPPPKSTSPPPSSIAVRRRLVACAEGTRCHRQRDAQHLAQEAHPFDPDYAEICEATGVEQEQPSIRGLFEWVDVDNSGKISLKELEGALPLLEKLWGEPLHLSAKSWNRLDEDGNGCVNFSEFGAWAGPRLGLPLGVKHLFNVCSILGCPCQKFEEKSSKKRTSISFISKLRPQTCKCGHKHGAHNHDAPSGLEVPYPTYWLAGAGDFSKLVPVDKAMLQVLQKLLDKTYQNTWTRDRKKHNPEAPEVPKGYQVVRAVRSENSKYWQEYCVRRAELSRSRADAGKDEEFVEYSDVKSVKAWVKFAGSSADRLRPECNEWYLFHGTSPEAAEKICDGDFKICLAGSSTGTLYGRGCYFSESITKADEYAKANSDGERALLVCRALGGRVRYTAEEEPDPEELTDSCIEGPYDCILGDREKCRNTFREFVFYDTENVYAEYVVYYKRNY